MCLSGSAFIIGSRFRHSFVFSHPRRILTEKFISGYLCIISNNFSTSSGKGNIPEPLCRLANIGNGHPILISTSLYPFSMKRDKIASALLVSAPISCGIRWETVLLPGSISRISLLRNVSFSSRTKGV